MKRKFVANVHNEEVEFFIEKLDGGKLKVTHDDKEFLLDTQKIGDSHYLALSQNQVFHIGLTRQKDNWQAHLEGEVLNFTLEDEKSLLRKRLVGSVGAGGGEIVCPMPGKIVKFLVEEGQSVKTGDPVVIVEAMKMENEFKAGIDGTVKEIKAAAGESVESGAVLVVIEEE